MLYEQGHYQDTFQQYEMVGMCTSPILAGKRGEHEDKSSPQMTRPFYLPGN